MNEAPNHHFRFCIFTFDTPHYIAAAFRANNIDHSFRLVAGLFSSVYWFSPSF
jgi:hypothetical protein